MAYLSGGGSMEAVTLCAITLAAHAVHTRVEVEYPGEAECKRAIQNVDVLSMYHQDRAKFVVNFCLKHTAPGVAGRCETALREKYKRP